jgi:hypothetical protein
LEKRDIGIRIPTRYPQKSLKYNEDADNEKVGDSCIPDGCLALTEWLNENMVKIWSIVFVVVNLAHFVPRIIKSL